MSPSTLKPELVREANLGFQHGLVVGAAAKEIVRTVLDSSGYSVHPFGYESTFSTMKHRLKDKRFQDDVAQRIRSMPDFLVSDEEESPKLVEVKFRGQGHKIGLKNFEIWRYNKYWAETVLVVLSPFGDRFFAQYVKNLKLEGDTYKDTWFEYTAFAALSSVFPRTKGRLESFHVGIDKLARFWKEERE